MAALSTDASRALVEGTKNPNGSPRHTPTDCLAAGNDDGLISENVELRDQVAMKTEALKVAQDKLSAREVDLLRVAEEADRQEDKAIAAYKACVTLQDVLEDSKKRLGKKKQDFHDAMDVAEEAIDMNESFYKAVMKMRKQNEDLREELAAMRRRS